MKHGHRGRILIIVQNLPVPFDRRVWLECGTLTDAGYQVAVVCPKGPGDPSYAVVDGVELYKYRPYAPGGSKVSFVAEYLYSFVATLWLTIKAARRGRFAAIQSCNPPDIFWPIGVLFRVAARVTLRLRPPRPVPRDLRVPLSRWHPGHPQGTAPLGTEHHPLRRSRHLHQRLLPGHRHRTRRGRPPTTSPWCAPGLTPSDSSAMRPTPACSRTRRTWWPTSG